MANVRGGATEFRRWITKMASSAAAAGGDLHRRVHLYLDSELVARSPVGQPAIWQRPAPPGYVGGHFRGEWQATIGEPALEELTAPDEQRAAAVAVSANQAMLVALKPGQRSYEVNRSPYGAALNTPPGHSRQAPGGRFVEKAIQATKVAAEIGAL